MRNLTATIPHQLTRAEVKRRIDEQVAFLRRQQGGVPVDLQTTWVHDTMTFSAGALGQSISGHLTVDDQAVHLTVVLPWLVSILAGTIKQKIELSVRQALGAPANPSGQL